MVVETRRWRATLKRRQRLARQVQRENAAKCKPARIVYSRDNPELVSTAETQR